MMTWDLHMCTRQRTVVHSVNAAVPVALAPCIPRHAHDGLYLVASSLHAPAAARLRSAGHYLPRTEAVHVCCPPLRCKEELRCRPHAMRQRVMRGAGTMYIRSHHWSRQGSRTVPPRRVVTRHSSGTPPGSPITRITGPCSGRISSRRCCRARPRASASAFECHARGGVCAGGLARRGLCYCFFCRLRHLSLRSTEVRFSWNGKALRMVAHMAEELR